MTSWFEQLSALRERLGTRELARRLKVPPPSLRRVFSTKRASARFQKAAASVYRRHEAARARTAERRERLAIQQEPPRFVPGYGPEKTKRVLAQLRQMRADTAIAWQEARDGLRALSSMAAKGNLQNAEKILKIQAETVQNFLSLETKLANAELRMLPPEAMTLQKILDSIELEQADRKLPGVARKYHLSSRAVYTLYFSPPSLGRST